ncbi:MAG: ATP-binding protein [Thermodesulfobacteriota bacterium]
MFEEIDGHKTAKLALKAAVESGRAAHAYIFSGPGGAGKKLTALSFAKKLNCPLKTDGICDCNVCARIENGVHPDVSLFEYTESRIITVDNVREEIETRIFLKPFEAKYKIFIVDDAERMNSSAQNAFLKTLEEPPPYSVIMLITQLPSMILPTIRSRCRTVAFGKLDGRVAREKLTERGDLSPEEIDLAVTIADGSPGKALKTGAEETRKTLETLKALCAARGAGEAGVFKFVENILGKAKGTAAQRVEAEKLADSAALLIRDLIHTKAGEDSMFPDWIPGDFAAKTGADEITEKARALEEMAAGVKLGNLNCRIALEKMVFRFAKP